MTHILLLTCDPLLAESARQLEPEGHWRFRVEKTLAAALEGESHFPLAILDVRPAPGSDLWFAAVLNMTLQPENAGRFQRVLCVGALPPQVGRMNAYLHGGSAYAVLPTGSEASESGLKSALAEAIRDALALPAYQVIDFHDSFPNRDFYREVIESMQVSVVIITADGIIKLMNVRALAQFDYATQLVVDRHWYMLVAPSDRQTRAPEVQERLRGAFFHECRLRCVDRHGREFPAFITSSRVYSELSPEPLIVLTLQDLSEMEALQRQVIAFQRLESVERVVAGMTHEFNNLLTAILGHAEMLAQDLPAGSELQRSADIIRREADSARELTTRLLGLSSSRQFLPGPVSCNALLRNTRSLVLRSLGPRVHLEVHELETDHSVDGDAGQLQQVLLNLCLNARDAIAETGMISIQVRRREVTPEDCRRCQDATPGDYVEIRVSDNGCGMPAEVLDRVFEPFFTTKPVGKGSGLGLAVVRGIVRGHGGHIDIDSAVGKGTTVSIRLPAPIVRAAEGTAGLPGELSADKAGAGSGAGILIVDDDHGVLVFTQKALQRAGYRTWLASAGELAMNLFDQHAGEIALVLLDLTMPRISGREVIKYIRQKNRQVPVILTTGYAPGGIDDGLIAEVQAFLKKPFNQAELLEVVGEVMGSAAHNRESGPSADV
ncbi:MAG: hypothetical protein AMXMBFR13_09840 [Phycisphaerae bacterium]